MLMPQHNEEVNQYSGINRRLLSSRVNSRSKYSLIVRPSFFAASANFAFNRPLMREINTLSFLSITSFSAFIVYTNLVNSNHIALSDNQQSVNNPKALIQIYGF